MTIKTIETVVRKMTGITGKHITVITAGENPVVELEQPSGDPAIADRLSYLLNRYEGSYRVETTQHFRSVFYTFEVAKLIQAYNDGVPVFDWEDYLEELWSNPDAPSRF